MAKAKAPAKPKSKLYKMPDPIPLGEILQDVSKTQWKLGKSIGKGGFGEIYEAQKVTDNTKDFPYVIKIEPHENGPLFVEMHFYTRNCKKADVDAFKTEKKLKSLGMPVYIGSGSHDYKKQKYRFIVMEKFATDVEKLYQECGRKLPDATVYRLGLQIIDVLEYIHGKGYVHADIKGSNILLSISNPNQAYLVDFGLVGRFTSEKVFKPDPKKKHNGTLEFLSRDAHQGVQTMRGDLEILAYNMIIWLGGGLPWERETNPETVQRAKEKAMDDVNGFIKTAIKTGTTTKTIVEFLKYINSLEFNEAPNYEKIRKTLKAGLLAAGGDEKSPLEFKSSTKRKSTSASREESPIKKAKKPAVRRGRKANNIIEDENGDVEEEDDDEDIPKENSVVPPKRGRRKVADKEADKAPPKPKARTRRVATIATDDGVIMTAEMLRIKNLALERAKNGVARRRINTRLNRSLDNIEDLEEEEPEKLPVSRRARK